MEAMDPEQGQTGTGPGGERPDLAADLRALGENLRDALRAAWGSQERERFQAEVERGLRELRQAVTETFEETARDVKSGERRRERMAEARARAAGVREELRSGQMGGRVRREIHELLDQLNEQLRRSRQRWTPRRERAPGGVEEPP